MSFCKIIEREYVVFYLVPVKTFVVSIITPCNSNENVRRILSTNNNLSDNRLLQQKDKLKLSDNNLTIDQSH